jgi:molybdenum cofactor guanylyltransferase
LSEATNPRSSGVSAIVLAGGRATRFGSDKLVAELNGEPLLDRAIGAVRTIADEVIVAGRSTAEPGVGRMGEDPAIRSIPDATPFAGPLAGLAAGLEVAHGRLAIVVGADMPRLVPAVLHLLLARLEAEPSITAATLSIPDADAAGATGRPQVLPLALAVNEARDSARAALGAGDRSLLSLVARLTSAEIPATVWLRLDPDASTLLDVDTAEDLARIRDRELR